MEDSYTVHRRRKAAAKKREKTPEPSSRSHLLDDSEDEEAARRARMQQMADDAEKQEEESKMKLQEDTVREEEIKSEKKSKDQVNLARDSERIKSSGTLEDASKKRRSHGEDRPVDALRARETDATAREEMPVKVPPVKKEPSDKAKEESPKKEPAEIEVTNKDKIRDTLPRSKEVDDDGGKVTEARKVERRVKKKSRERVERHSRSSDSSDIDKKEPSPRRTKSPESSRIRVKKSSGKSKLGEADVMKKDLMEKPPREKRLSNRQKVEESETLSREKSEKRQPRPYSQTDDTDETPMTMKKSETFPRRTPEESVIKRSSSDIKKQIIPISNETLVQDFARAQRDYLMREQSILERDLADALPDTEEEFTLRRRKLSVAHTESEHEEIAKSIEVTKEPTKKQSWFSWFSWLRFFHRKEKVDEPCETKVPEDAAEEPLKEEECKIVEAKGKIAEEKVTLMDFFRALRDVVAEFRAFVAQNPREVGIIKDLRNLCIVELILMIIYCGLGAFIFRFTEGAFETFYKCGVKRVKRDFLDSLWNYSHNLREEDWKSMARKKLMEFEEQLHAAHEAGVHSYSGQRSWTFLNAVVYCITVITTIGYGHISPSTTTGRAITIIYAIFGIPMFLIILADFGKLFTRGIKFLWAFVRRLYYTGSCRKVRRTGPVQEVMKGVQLVYDFATFRRPSQMTPEDIEEIQRQAQQSQTVLNLDGNAPDTPGTPAMSNYAIDDEFNLPISVAIFILLGYIFVGAALYYMWEDWGFFESFYFVFISMSTIGFGDYVPKHPIYMMCSIIYLVFGLALTSMCINVVQVMLSDSFKQASQKIGATIGFQIAEDDGSVKPAPPPPVEVADVHTSIKDSESVEKIAPKAKQEEIDL